MPIPKIDQNMRDIVKPFKITLGGCYPVLLSRYLFIFNLRFWQSPYQVEYTSI